MRGVSTSLSVAFSGKFPSQLSPSAYAVLCQSTLLIPDASGIEFTISPDPNLGSSHFIGPLVFFVDRGNTEIHSAPSALQLVIRKNFMRTLIAKHANYLEV